MKKRAKAMKDQYGLSLIGLILGLAILALVAVLAMKVTPTVVEYFSIKRAITTAKASSTTVRDIQAAFDRQAITGYIDSINSKDLEITKNGTDIEVGFAYQKKIPLFGPVSLLIDYAGSTANISTKKSE